MTRAERHRAAQERYRATDKGRATIKRYQDYYISTGKHCDVQARYRRREAEARDAELGAELGLDMRVTHKLRAL
jgi:hypothetical protein